MFKKIFVVLALAIAIPLPVSAGEGELYGTWKLISSQRVILETGERVDSFGPNPTGYITYGRDGRMMTIVVQGDRKNAQSIDKLTDQDRSELFKSMAAYGGTYKFYGDRIEHFIDISWNEIWTGTVVVRDVKIDGDRLVYTTKPGPFSLDGKISVNTLVWEKVK